MHWLDWIVIGLYFALIGWVAWWYGRHQKDSVDYFLAGRNAGWVVIGASIFTSNIGSEHIVGLAGQGAATGMAMAHWELHAWCLIVLAGSVRAVLLQVGRPDHPGVPGTALQRPHALDSLLRLAGGLRVHQGQRHRLCRRDRVPGAAARHVRLAAKRLLGRRLFHGDHHRHLHRVRRHARHHVHRHAPGGDHPARLVCDHLHRPRRSWAAVGRTGGHLQSQRRQLRPLAAALRSRLSRGWAS